MFAAGPDGIREFFSLSHIERNLVGCRRCVLYGAAQVQQKVQCSVLQFNIEGVQYRSLKYVGAAFLSSLQKGDDQKNYK